MSLKNQIRNLIPEHIRDKYPLYVQFLELYYEWMESEGQAYDILSNHLNYLDMTKRFDAYVDMMRAEVMPDIPKNTLVDEAVLVRHIKDLYQRKGTEDSIKFIFRILFNETPTIYYPREDMFTLSDDGRLSSEKKLQDSHYYQNYSYVIRSTIEPELYEDLIKKLIHPAGMKAFMEQV